VILVVGDGTGWEMIRAGAVAKQVIAELEELGVDIKEGATGDIAAAAKEAFAGRTLDDYYTEGELTYQQLRSSCTLPHSRLSSYVFSRKRKRYVIPGSA